MKIILPIVASFSGGALVGGAYTAFFTLVKLFPRFIQFTETEKYSIYYEFVFTIGSILFTFIYFSDSFYINIGEIGVFIIGLLFGIFIGAFSSALAEILNVVPVLTNKFKLRDHIKFISASLGLGKVCGAIYYFIVYLGG